MFGRVATGETDAYPHGLKISPERQDHLEAGPHYRYTAQRQRGRRVNQHE
jgi:hypothetical protein